MITQTELPPVPFVNPFAIEPDAILPTTINETEVNSIVEETLPIPDLLPNTPTLIDKQEVNPSSSSNNFTGSSYVLLNKTKIIVTYYIESFSLLGELKLRFS